MAINLYINGVDQSALVVWKSLSWKQSTNQQADTIQFQIQKFGTRTLVPNVLDEILLYYNGDKVFGGSVVQITENIAGVDCQIYNVTAKDYSHLMDRRLVIEKYTSKPVINIICDILNRYINKGDRIEIASFETNELWSGGTVDTVNFRVGDQARKLTSTNLVAATMSRAFRIDLSTGFSTSDFIEVDVYIDSFAKLSNCTLKLGDSTLSAYYSKNVTSQITADGWNLVRVARSAFASTGSPSWATIAKLQIEVTATAANTVNVTFDNWQQVKTTAFTRDCSNTATQVVNFIAFNYEEPSKCIKRMADLFQWSWFVDANKCIHFFAKFDTGAAFNLTDTSGKYVYKSLVMDSSADQIRNSIYVRGGDYLATAITEDLSHQVDGSNKIFKLGYKYANYELYRGAVQLNVGIDNIDSFQDNINSTQLLSGGTPIKLGDVAANTRQSQQVIVTKHGGLKKIKLRVRKVGAPTGNFEIQIFADSGSNTPSTTDISNKTTLAAASITTDFVEYTFTMVEKVDGNLHLNPPSSYHIVLTRSTAVDASNYFEIDAVPIGNYVGTPNTYDGASWTIGTSNFYFIELYYYDALYSFNEKIVTFETAPIISATITWTAQPYLPIIIQYRDIASISEFGEYQFRVIDKSIQTKDGAKQRALEEILAYSQEISEASFKTYADGLRVGQTITVQSTIRGINQDLIINSITAKARTNDSFEYSVKCVTTKTMGLINWLQNQILKDNQQIVIDDNELADKTDSLAESFSFSVTYGFTIYTGKVWSNDAGTTPNALQYDGGATHIWI